MELLPAQKGLVRILINRHFHPPPALLALHVRLGLLPDGALSCPTQDWPLLQHLEDGLLDHRGACPHTCFALNSRGMTLRSCEKGCARFYVVLSF